MEKMAGESGEELTGLRKAAVLAVMLGPEKAAEAISHSKLGQPEIERLAGEVARLEGVDEATQQAVAEEFRQLAAAGESQPQGVAAAEELLRRALGPEKAAEVMPWVRPRRSGRPFASLAQLEPRRLLDALREEQPLATAVVLRHLPRRVAGEVLSGLPEEVRMDVVMHVAKGGEPFGEGLRQMESALGRKAAALGAGGTGEEETEEAATAGPRALVEILNQADLSVENAVLEALVERDPELGEQVRESMFVFADLPRLDTRAVQMAVREVEASDLALALKGASEEIKNLVFENLSENAAAGLKEDLESLGRVRRRDVYSAQEKVVVAVRTLADEGKINIRQETEEEEEEMVE